MKDFHQLKFYPICKIGTARNDSVSCSRRLKESKMVKHFNHFTVHMIKNFIQEK